MIRDDMITIAQSASLLICELVVAAVNSASTEIAARPPGLFQ